MNDATQAWLSWVRRRSRIAFIRLFCSVGDIRFDGVPYRLDHGVPILVAAMATVVCELDRTRGGRPRPGVRPPPAVR